MGEWVPVSWARKGERREDSWALTWQESRPCVPAQSMSSLMILVLLFEEKLA